MDYFIKFKNLNPNILVIGDVMIDKYIYCDINRFSKEESIPILDVTNTEYCIGGAGNVCNNIVKLNYAFELPLDVLNLFLNFYINDVPNLPTQL